MTFWLNRRQRALREDAAAIGSLTEPCAKLQ
jgi:hypothetical protein